MLDAAVKEMFSQLAKKYDPEVVFKIWAQVGHREGSRICFGNWLWEQKITMEKVMDHLNDYFCWIESLIQDASKNLPCPYKKSAKENRS